MKNKVIKIPDIDIVVILAHGVNLRNIPILVNGDQYEKLHDLVGGTFYVNVSKRTAYSFYAKQVRGVRVIKSMHRILTECPEGMVVDHHPNHYGLDNRKDNLTVVTFEENAANYHTEKNRPVLFESLRDLSDVERIKEDIELIKKFRVRI